MVSILSHSLILASPEAQPSPHTHTLGLALNALHSQGQNVMHLHLVCCTREQPQPQALEEKLLTLLGHPQQIHLLKRRAAGCQTHIGGGGDLQNRCLENAEGATSHLHCGFGQGAMR